jgi:hypothetical protein
MKRNRWMFAALVAGGALFAARGCIGGCLSSGGSPDDKLASQKNFGDTIAAIESIKDDAQHDARARAARGTMLAPLAACHDTWEQFGEAVEGNPDAAEMVNHAMDRLERTVNIIFAGNPSASRFTFRDLPSQLESALSKTIR